MNERESLLVLMENALKEQKKTLEFESLEQIISDEKKCAEILKNVLNDPSFKITNGELYEVSQGRAQHSIINYVLGLVFRKFADLFDGIDKVVQKRIMSDKGAADEAWFLIALNHDVGYFCKDILSGKEIEYEKDYTYYLFKDDYAKPYESLNNMSSQAPELYAFSYSDILEYDEKDRKRRKNNPDNKEKINHGIYGGQYYFNRMLQKFDKKGNVEDKEVKMVKAVAITIAQHNMYKSGSPKDNHFYPDKLHYESNFVINEDYPLLLFLALIDTVECVKKLGKTANRKCFFQAKTVLKSIRVRVESDSIEIDYSELKSRLDRKNDENLKRNYNDYMGAVKGLDKWTRFEAVEKEDVLRIHMKPRHENN